MPARDPTDLIRNPNAGGALGKTPPAPVIVALDNLVTVDGLKLELLTRTNPVLAMAAQLGYIYTHTIKMEDGTMGSEYVAGRIGQIERLSVSMGGQGRADQIAALQAGGSVPDSYFEHGKSGQFTSINED